MTTTAEIADFALGLDFGDLRDETKEELKKRVLDSIGIGIAAMDEEPVGVVGETVAEFGGEGCSLWGDGRSSSSDATTASPSAIATASPPDAAMYNTALVRYLDYMDSFLAPGETPHPSDNIAGIVACGEYAEASGEELITAIAVAYEVQGALAWTAPVRDRGWDHVTHTVISAATGAGTILGLEREQLRSAIGIAGTAHNALRVTRTEGISEWKGIASANAARNAVYSVFLAKNGLDGPKNLFEGQKGWKQIVSGEFEAEFTPGERVHDVMTKKYVAETYAQSAVEGIIELAEREEIDPAEVAQIRLDTFAGAKLIIGGGEGSRYEVETKAQADHSLPYMLAVALIDRKLGNDQYEPERIRREDVQTLLRKVEVVEDPNLTTRFEDGEMPAIVEVEMEDGTRHFVEKDEFEGHPNDSMSWDEIERKFHETAGERYEAEKREEIIEMVRGLEERQVSELVELVD
jgi:2-methylcitrate dehydratase